MENYDKLADLIFGDIDRTPADYEAIYPERNLKEGARVTRIAPSPTGYLHLGVLFSALVDERIAHGSDGVFYVRIEDTDKKREVEGGLADIIQGFVNFGLKIDEGFTAPDRQEGLYGSYQQSQRRDIYRCYVKDLMKKGLAYPCFCTAEELAAVREEQDAQKLRTGYYGKWAKCRDISYAEAKEKIEAGQPFVVRLKSPGSENNRIVFDDMIKGKIEMPENDQDIVLLKTDGIPTYHFAHAVDDHLMRTTHVIRGDEWIASTPIHLQLFKLLGFKVPKYAHISPIMKEENGGKRKLSKRKDPEAAVHYYAEQGYPADSVIEYLLTLMNSDFEDWRRMNLDAPNTAFKVNFKKMSVSGALFDLVKLNDVSKNTISRMPAETVCAQLLKWAEEYDPAFYALLQRDPAYTQAVFSIDRGGKKPRKDIAKWSDAKEYAAYFYDELFVNTYALPENICPADAAAAMEAYIPLYSEQDDQNEWFEKLKQVSPQIGYASEVKAYKADPSAYKGHVGDIGTMVRVAITGRTNSPDLCEIMKVLGKERSVARLQKAAEIWKNQ
ncbi:MAG TPA: glutamate--tRNA ligase [Firmicutes bacterium]|nr:glutamate--tRNA ligase [Bacillota bacterium]